MNENQIYSKIQFQELATHLLVQSELQPRKQFDVNALHELAETIKANGIIMPIIVRPKANGTYEIVAGERRWRAAQMVGLKEVPCLISQHPDEKALINALIENIARRDLNPMEEAKGISRLIEDFNYSHEEAARVLGKSRSEVTNILRLLKLDSKVQILINKGDLNKTHGRVLAEVAVEKQYEMARQTVAKDWSSRTLEKAITDLKKPKKKLNLDQSKSSDIKRLERKLSEHLCAAVSLENSKKKWTIRIDCNSLDELEGVFEKSGWNYE